ncbi:hypothetical protein [Aliarcobacter butzleri]|uniref:hypothetical protein n=1 Tax=Aliarcobacter butzleri TaxID=28197 RepID=UPI001EDC5886|nr:hypothetical protein [Aliarcobacter butzleri]MCP3650449.1 hypothetical protein [Arcobacter sp. DNRA7]MCG3702595.1 hypothetical protein [Aliarcobacter butzleri]MCR1816622.1 hypothetical protein [Aliarcobacter butzleri]MCT7569202.1 hypothetical protein [Aliarcobacter butzleri]MDS1315947.1 hypothetical protein [Aliarcobacter butzleri]
MSKNSIGTVFRIILIFFSLVSFWLVILAIFYFLISIIFNIELSLKTYFILFSCFIIFRMFYPKNVFV